VSFRDFVTQQNL